MLSNVLIGSTVAGQRVPFFVFEGSSSDEGLNVPKIHCSAHNTEEGNNIG